MQLIKVTYVVAIIVALYLLLLELDIFDKLIGTNSCRVSCPWKFVEYVQSPYEKMWLENAQEWGPNPCLRYPHDDNERIAKYWYNYTLSALTTSPNSPPDTSIFDTLVYQRTCNGEKKKIYIEPLALLLRNPLLCSFYNTYEFTVDRMVDKSYLLVDWEGEEQRKDSNGRTFLFDMGASLYNSGLGGASQSWFVAVLEQRGLKLDGIYAWEYTVIKPEEVFKNIPQRLWAIYHWYNIPVTDKERDMANPWEMMKNVATVDDFVVAKLDIDNPALEVALIHQLVHSDEIAKLIDVLYWEDHFDTKEMTPIFGTKSQQKLQDTMALFIALREKGIRAHPWV